MSHLGFIWFQNHFFGINVYYNQWINIQFIPLRFILMSLILGTDSKPYSKGLCCFHLPVPSQFIFNPLIVGFFIVTVAASSDGIHGGLCGSSVYFYCWLHRCTVFFDSVWLSEDIIIFNVHCKWTSMTPLGNHRNKTFLITSELARLVLFFVVFFLSFKVIQW